MVASITDLTERAEEIFTDLGYTVSDSDGELRAERKWRVVRVMALENAADLPETGDLRCFVALERQATALRESILEAAPEYDWALISIEDSDYEVFHPPDSALV